MTNFIFQLYFIRYLVLATGFDGVTGSFTQLDIIGADGTCLRDQWVPGCKTYLGMTVPNFPNMLYCYGPQGPTAFGNGPPTVELQGDWMCNVIADMEKNGKKVFSPTWEAADAWTVAVSYFSIEYCGWYPFSSRKTDDPLQIKLFFFSFWFRRLIQFTI